ncbi:hypothetical protein [Fervidobacterium sp.]
MSLNKRTVILLFIAIVIWIIAIVVLYITYAPKKNSGSSTVQTVHQSQQSLQNTSQASITNKVDSIGQNYQKEGLSAISLGITDFASEIQIKIEIPNIFKPYFVDLDRLVSKLGEVSEKNNDSSEFIDDITSDNMKYHGFLKLADSKIRIVKVYLTINDETKSWLSEEIIDGKYKIITISSKELILLDITDGKIKKIRTNQ